MVTTTEFLLGLLDHSRFVAAEHDTVLVESLLL
ncbi:hypothetical protein UG55_109719 [Frankia sp. EI5c]|nr:hypothetical protein UG55_109719 [Frankia sp. EI5c]